MMTFSLYGDRPTCHGNFGTAESKLRRSETVPSASPVVPANFKQFGVGAQIPSTASGI
jgi:hypothetical protein